VTKSLAADLTRSAEEHAGHTNGRKVINPDFLATVCELIALRFSQQVAALAFPVKQVLGVWEANQVTDGKQRENADANLWEENINAGVLNGHYSKVDITHTDKRFLEIYYTN